MSSSMRWAPALFLSLALSLCLAAAPCAADVHPTPKGKPPAEAPDHANAADKSTVPPHPLPPEATTEHTLELAGRTIHFTAKAGAIRLSNAKTGEPLADVSYVAFLRDDTDPSKRPITFAINGGPGAASAWLDLGGLGPWRLPMTGEGDTPSAPPVTVPNADTWLDFTDLVFIDPVGTGYSRFLTKDSNVQKEFYSVKGDIDVLAVVIRKWLAEHKRLQSPKFIVGESYGGFRAPRIAYRLEDHEGIGVAGLIMVSPVLDFAWFDDDNSPLNYAAHLPTFAAAARDLTGPDPRSKLADVEAYASGPYIVDLLRGERDPAALARISEKVAKFTGLDPALVRRLGGRISVQTFARERERAKDRVSSLYDALTTGYDPFPYRMHSEYSDPILDALKVPLASAMANITATKLKWFVNARYEILNEDVTRRWDWGSGRRPPEDISDLRRLLALDPHLHVLIAHGVTDTVTPYFASKLLIDQIPPLGDPNRLKLVVYAGGHMFYALDQSRAALHADAEKVIEGK